jgi:hypothetical protein
LFCQQYFWFNLNFLVYYFWRAVWLPGERGVAINLEGQFRLYDPAQLTVSTVRLTAWQGDDITYTNPCSPFGQAGGYQVPGGINQPTLVDIAPGTAAGLWQLGGTVCNQRVIYAQLHQAADLRDPEYRDEHP